MMLFSGDDPSVTTEAGKVGLAILPPFLSWTGLPGRGLSIWAAENRGNSCFPGLPAELCLASVAGVENRSPRGDHGQCFQRRAWSRLSADRRQSVC